MAARRRHARKLAAVTLGIARGLRCGFMSGRIIDGVERQLSVPRRRIRALMLRRCHFRLLMAHAPSGSTFNKISQSQWPPRLLKNSKVASASMPPISAMTCFA